MGKLNILLNGNNYGANLPVWKAWTLRKGLIIAGSVLLLLIAAGVVYALIPHDPPKVKVTCVEEPGDDYDVMNERDIICKLQKEQGLDIRDLMAKRIKNLTFESFKQADASARALYGIGKWKAEGYAKSVDAYKVAETKASGTEANYDFYQRYALAALTTKDKNTYYQLSDKAKTAAQKDTKLSDAERVRIIGIIEGDKKFVEQEK